MGAEEVIPTISQQAFDEAMNKAAEKWIETVERNNGGPLSENVRASALASFSYGFMDGFQCSADLVKEWSKTLPLIPVNYGPPPPTPPRRQAG